MKSLITEPLGLYGWKNLEAVILAALATEGPMLLIGKHGSAKSFILERLAEALKMDFRFYNASLINYDDLVGIPIPTDDKKSLTYITNKTSIWDAEVVFIDEINRTKYELQNKLFPIIYDKRVQGQDLTKLKYRWAAMNPPANDDEEDDQYVGAMTLDPALVDRFAFMIKVPTWDDLNDRDKENMLKDIYGGKHEFPVDIHKLIDETKENIEKVKSDSLNIISKYIVALMQLLQNSFGYISARRAGILLETLVAVHAARITLDKYSYCTDDKNDKCKTRGVIRLEDSSILQLENALPITVTKDIKKATLMTLCKEAWLRVKANNQFYDECLSIKEPENRLIYVLNNRKKFKENDLSDIVLSLVQNFDERKKRACALISFLALKNDKDRPASMMETLAMISRDCFTVLHSTTQESMNVTNIFHQVVKETDNKATNELEKYKSNLLNSFLPHGYDNADQVKELSRFYSYLASKVNMDV